MSARRRSPRTRLPGCLADRRLHQAHLDTGTLTLAVAAGLAASRRRPQTMTTNQTCCAPDPPLSPARIGRLRCSRRRCFVWFSRVLDALPEQCLRRIPRASPLVAAIFRTKWLLSERCSDTCQRRRRPGQARRRQGRLQITADLYALARSQFGRGDAPDPPDLRACPDPAGRHWLHAEWVDLWTTGWAVTQLTVCFLSSTHRFALTCAAGRCVRGAR